MSSSPLVGKAEEKMLYVLEVPRQSRKVVIMHQSWTATTAELLPRIVDGILESIRRPIPPHSAAIGIGIGTVSI